MNSDDVLDKIDNIIKQLYELKYNVTELPQFEQVIGGTENFEYLTYLVNASFPEAIEKPYLLDRNSESQQQERARTLMEFWLLEKIDAPISEMSFLDFGCAEGYVVQEAAKYFKTAVGCDVNTSTQWSDKPYKFVTSLDQINDKFDIILAFDVIDHLLHDEPRNVLAKLANLLKDNGKIFIRFHPYLSRHATHLYHTLNKAYLHLFFDEIEIARLGGHSGLHHLIKTMTPREVYDGLVQDAGLKILNCTPVILPVEPFFRNPSLLNRMKVKTDFKFMSAPAETMSIQYIDYILAKQLKSTSEPND